MAKQVIEFCGLSKEQCAVIETGLRANLDINL